MYKCIGLASFLVLINGSPSSHFGSSRSLRQGDLLSPLLFLLVVEVLGRTLDRAVVIGMLEGLQVWPNGMVVSHFQFADDTLILCANSQRQIRYMRCILRCFEAVIGLHVNFGKSTFIAIEEVPNIDMHVTKLGCIVAYLQVSYISLPGSLL